MFRVGNNYMIEDLKITYIADMSRLAFLLDYEAKSKLIFTPLTLSQAGGETEPGKKRPRECEVFLRNPRKEGPEERFNPHR